MYHKINKNKGDQRSEFSDRKLFQSLTVERMSLIQSLRMFTNKKFVIANGIA